MEACRWSNFFWTSTLKTNDFLCFDEIQFVTLTWKGGEGSDYLFCCLFTDDIFCWEGSLLTGDVVIICFVVCLWIKYIFVMTEACRQF